MRFAIKTSPQNTTWEAMLEVWGAADQIEFFESAWTSDHFYPTHSADPLAARMEGWVTLTALAQATRRLERGGVRCVRDRARRARGAQRPLRRGLPDHHQPLDARNDQLRGRAPAQFTRARDVLHRHCADVGRDPGQIRLSCQVPYTGDPAAAAIAAEFRAEGAELAIVYLPKPCTPMPRRSRVPLCSRAPHRDHPLGRIRMPISEAGFFVLDDCAEFAESGIPLPRGPYDAHRGV